MLKMFHRLLGENSGTQEKKTEGEGSVLGNEYAVINIHFEEFFYFNEGVNLKKEYHNGNRD